MINAAHVEFALVAAGLPRALEIRNEDGLCAKGLSRSGFRLAIWAESADAEILTADTAAPVLCCGVGIEIGSAPDRVRGVLMLDYLDFDHIGDFSLRTRKLVERVTQDTLSRYAKVLGRAGYATEKLEMTWGQQVGLYVRNAK